DIKVIDVSGKGNDQIRSCHIQHVRQRNLRKNLECIRPVHFCRLVKLSGDILEHACKLEQCIRYADPDINDDDCHPCPCRIRKERKARVLRYQAQVSQKYVHRSLRLKHCPHNQQGNEHRHCTGEHKAEPPESFCSCPFPVDHQR